MCMDMRCGPVSHNSLAEESRGQQDGWPRPGWIWLPIFALSPINTVAFLNSSRFRLILVTTHTKANAATNGCNRGTASQSTGEGTLGRRLRYRMCSTRVRMSRTIYLPSGATSHRVGSGYADRMDPGPAQRLGQELLWACPLQRSSLLLNSRFFGKAAPVFSNHAHFLAAQTCVLDCHAEKRVLVVLIVRRERILVKHHQFRIIGAHSCKIGELCSDRSDQARLSLHTFFVRHR